MCGKVRVWEEKILLPTYKIGAPNKNPMFLEKRVYQGSSGKVYPHTVIDRIFDEKEDKAYTAVYLENDYIKVMVLPEIGGRIQRATDKTNGYDFVYYNHVIKPALVGLAGPWISGGIEFNWPQHHRPSTFDPVDFSYRTNPDGSATIVVGEIENMFRTKGMASFTLYPDSTYIEIKAQLFNRTDLPQTFLWWANPAVPVNDNTRSIFPPDVTAVMDHGKRDVSTFPIATGTYYKVDYSRGVDISRYKNLPVPTSYMAAKSDYDFVGGYDDGVQAGILHVADHHISPGKKQWAWGCGDFGKAWDRNLTDSDGPYVELMTGCFTDNQPDFTWIAPMEEKRFTQYFMPYQKLGTVHNATKDLAMNYEDGSVHLYATGNVGELTLEVYAGDACAYNETFSLSPTDFKEIPLHNVQAQKIVLLRGGREYLTYLPDGKKQEIPQAAVCPPDPADCATTEDLYLYGLHITQYRHATYAPEDYFKEGLRRDPTDIRLNNAYGLLLLRQGYFKESEPYFRAAVQKAIRSNPNPYDSEPYYNLGLCLLYQGRLSESYDAFYKSTWSNACQEAAFYHMACICARQGDFETALAHLDDAIIKNGRNYKALDLKAMLLLKTEREEQAHALAETVRSLDALDTTSGRILGKAVSMNHNHAIEIAIEFAAAGLYEDAIEVLREDNSGYPLVAYYLGAYYQASGKTAEAAENYQRAAAADSFGCFPHRLEDIGVLQNAIEQNPGDAMAWYYLGNLYYDKKRHDDALACFEKGMQMCPSFPTAFRNAALLYMNHRHDACAALSAMETAFKLDESDARVLMELDCLYKKTQKSPEQRLKFLESHAELLPERDDLYLEYITLLNLNGRAKEAYDKLMGHHFHPWEGGEGKVPAQYVYSLVLLAQQAAEAGDLEAAASLLEKTYTYPENLGEGKLFGAQENLQNYLLGLVFETQGEAQKANACFEKAATGLSEPQSAMCYNDQPPETIFCQGLALQKLGKTQEALQRFDKLIAYADAHAEDSVRIDYFAVSLPDFLVFDEDLNRKNRVHCGFMKALGLLGKDARAAAQDCFEKALAEDNSHFAMLIYKKLFA